MARGKKKESALTPAEKLAQALVPEEEQPYKVPNNWCWTTIGAINQYFGGSVDPLKEPDSWFELYSVPSSADNYPEIVQGSEIGSTKQEVQKNDVLLCKINPRINRVWRVSQHTENKLLGSSEWIVVRNSKINSLYLMWCFQTRYFREYMLSNVSGVGGSLMRAQPKYVQGYPIPIAPIEEQHRIVDRIEYLFAKLDEAKEKAQSVLESFETRKATILHKAFTGELIGKNNAEEACLESIVETIRIGPFGSALHKEDYVLNGVPVVNPKHIIGQQIIPEDKVTISYEKAEELASYKLKENDIVLGRRGEMGRSAPVVKEQAGWICGTGSMIIRLKQGYDAIFYSQIIASQPVVQYLEENSVGSTLKNLNEKIVRNLPIPKFSLTEQKRTIEILNSILLKEQQAEEATEAVVEKIDLLKKSILVRAFRGELGTNNPSEESAVELIKSVLSEKIQKDKPKGKREERKPEVEFVAKTIMQALSAGGKITPEKLKSETGLLIDDFYDQLKTLIDSGCVIETRIDGESYLEAKNEDRQPNN